MILPLKQSDIKGFGYRNGDWTFYSSSHRGDDFICDIGTPVYAVDNGVVVKSKWDGEREGNAIKIKHKLSLYSYYAHLKAFKVLVNQQVKRGDMIALSGNTGISTGPHLHIHIQYLLKYYSIYDYLTSNLEDVIKRITKEQKKKIEDLLNGNTVLLQGPKGEAYIVRKSKKDQMNAIEALMNALAVGIKQEDLDQIPNK